MLSKFSEFGSISKTKGRKSKEYRTCRRENDKISKKQYFKIVFYIILKCKILFINETVNSEQS